MESNSTTNSSETENGIVAFLREECGVCAHCLPLVIADHYQNEYSASSSSAGNDGDDDGNCTVCFGLLAPSYQKMHVLPMIEEALLPYCKAAAAAAAATTKGPKDDEAPPKQSSSSASSSSSSPLINPHHGNHLMRESPTVNLPWIIAARAQCAIAAAKWYIRNEPDPSKVMGIRLRPAEEVYSRMKEKIRKSLRYIMAKSLTVAPSSLMEDDDGDDDDDGVVVMEEDDKVVLSAELQEEESGYLGIHILILPPLGTNDVDRLVPPSLEAHVRSNQRQIQQAHNRILYPRKRFRGNDPTLKQGGEPRANLELRVRREKSQFRSDYEEGQRGAKKRCRLERNGEEGMKEDDEKEEAAAAAMAVPPTAKSFSGNKVHEWNTMISWLEKSIVLEWLEKETSRAGRKLGVNNNNNNNNSSALSTWLLQLHQQADAPSSASSSGRCSVHACAWRRPFYIAGTYTKSRRDISQTPFYVSSADIGGGNGGGANDDNNNNNNNGNNNAAAKSQFVRKGISSVEEETCPPMALVCGGIGQRNNERLPKSTADNGFGGQKGAVVYGMVKFHASGREDMDVRMLLPPTSIGEAMAREDVLITGRPFVCEIFDAHNMPSGRDLARVVQAINCQEEEAAKDGMAEETAGKEIERDGKGWPQTLVLPDRFHGKNPNGVGVSPLLSLAPARAFSSLQSETEEKVKWYGCVCWSSVPIASNEELLQKLGCMPWDKEGAEDDAAAAIDSCIYPLEIQQSTPLRVMHRRSSDVRPKYILSLSACRIDDHWFRLRMSTSAGTYVKEFVHGDCGRTHPSIGSMLGGRTDITELDCEGIAV